MAEITAFLSGCVDEDYEIVRTVLQQVVGTDGILKGDWHIRGRQEHEGELTLTIAEPQSLGASEKVIWVDGEERAAYIVAFPPTRALVDVEVRRRLLARHVPAEAGSEHCAVCGPGWPCMDLLLMAQTYHDRPGFEAAWKLPDMLPYYHGPVPFGFAPDVDWLRGAP
jgi:hypothetical protein